MTLRIQKCPRRGASALSISIGFVALLAAAPAHAQKDPKFDFGKPEEVKVGRVEGASQGRLRDDHRQLADHQRHGDRQRLAQGRQQQAGARGRRGLRALEQPHRRPSIRRHHVHRSIASRSPAPTTTTARVATIVSSPRTTPGTSAVRPRPTRSPARRSSAAARSATAGSSTRATCTCSSPRSATTSRTSATCRPSKTLDPVSIHSARVFAGETLKLSAATGVTASVEALFNLNKEGAAIRRRHQDGRRRRVQGHARQRQARIDDHAVQAAQHRLRLHAEVRPEPGGRCRRRPARARRRRPTPTSSRRSTRSARSR